MPGFPVIIMRAGLLARSLGINDGAPWWAYRFRAWEGVDPGQALLALGEDPGVVAGVDLATVQMLFAVEAVGLQGDWARLDSLLAELRGRLGEDDYRVRAAMAFWLAVRDRFEEAGNSLKLAGPVPEVRVPWNLSNDRNVGLMDTVIVRIHRGTGRDEEAGHLAAEALARLRPPNDLGDEPCPPSLWDTGLVAYASLAANEGQKEEAVRALRLAMHCGDLPFGFWPQLPWFQGLAGYAPYDQLVQERERRIRQIRAELIALEEGGGVPGPTAE